MFIESKPIVFLHLFNFDETNYKYLTDFIYEHIHYHP